MCTYSTERCAVAGSGKGPARWTQLATATVYYDHPVHAMADHTQHRPRARRRLARRAGSPRAHRSGWRPARCSDRPGSVRGSG